MKEFENINTQLPYTESESYVDALVERSAKKAGQHSPVEWKISRKLVYSAVGVAIAAALVLAVLIPSHKNTVPTEESPMELFLASLTDSEAAMIVDCPIEDIPEYY